MSSSSTPASQGDAQLLDIGHQCSAPSCNLHDFLPFKCQHCSLPFCAEHFKPADHKCAKYDETKYNRVAPSCPLCNTPVAIPPGQDPNIRMERHMQSECSVMTGRTKGSSMPHCARAKCGKVLFQPIRCESCRQQFCPQHRFPKDHSCTSLSNVQTTPSVPKQATPTKAAGSTAFAAIKRSLNSNTTTASRPAAPGRPALSSKPPAVPIQVAASSPMKPSPFSKADSSTLPATPQTIINVQLLPTNTNDTPRRCTPKSTSGASMDAKSFVPRRAKAERDSRRKAMQARAKKGLLSEEEKAILAAEEAEAAARKKDDCVIA